MILRQPVVAVLLALVLLLTAACGSSSSSSPAPAAVATPAPTPTPAPAPAPAPPPVSSGISAAAQAMLDAVNAQRSANGLAALIWNAKLENAAQIHSQDMSDHGVMSHTGSDGSSPSQRVTAAGYVWQTTGENIASGFTSLDAVMTGWMNSSGHRANILGSAYTQMGAARVGNYWTQVFGKPLSGNG